MSSSAEVTRRDFARIAMAGAGAAVLGGSVGFLTPEPELVLSLSGTARLLDPTGRVLDSRSLAPRLATAPLGADLIRARRTGRAREKLETPVPRTLGFRTTPALVAGRFHRTDRSRDGTVIETISETIGTGIPRRRIVQIPAHGVEIEDRFEYREAGTLSVFERRTIQVRKAGAPIAELTILASGEVRVGTLPGVRAVLAGSPFLPAELSAQPSCGHALIHYLEATIKVIAAILACGAAVICAFTIIVALIDWAMAINEIETCKEE